MNNAVNKVHEVFLFLIKWFKIEIAYVFSSSIFICCLNNLNRTLLEKYSELQVFAMLKHDNYKPLKYFGLTMLLVFLGSWNIFCKIKKIRETDLHFHEKLFFIVSIFVTAVFIVLLFIAINNPILKAIIIAVFLIGMLASSK